MQTAKGAKEVEKEFRSHGRGKEDKAAKKTTARTRKAAVKENISIQFAGREYTKEQLVKIAKDVWEFDLKKDSSDFKEVQLYVKPEEAKAYYVINGTETGSFDI